MQNAKVRRSKMSVKTLMLLSIFLTVTVGFTATIGFMMWQWMAQQDSLAKKHIRQIAEVQSLQVSKEMDSALAAARIWATVPWRCGMRASPIAKVSTNC